MTDREQWDMLVKFQLAVADFGKSTEMMKRSVAVLAEIKAMDQANMDRARQDYAPAYGEEHYLAVLEKL